MLTNSGKTSRALMIGKCFAIILVAGSSMTGSAMASVTGYEIVVDSTALNADPIKQLSVSCPKGKKAMGSGWAVLDKTDAILEGVATTNQPSFDGQSWLVNARNTSEFAKEWKLRVWVTCAKP